MGSITSQKSALTLQFLLRSPSTAVAFRSHLGAVLARQHTNLLGIFNHSNDGKNRNQSAMIRFCVDVTPSKSIGSIHALNEEAMLWLMALNNIQMPDDLSEKQLISGQTLMRPSNVSLQYNVQSLVVTKNATQYQLWQKSTNDQKKMRIQNLLFEGLKRQCETLRLDLGSTASLTPKAATIAREWSERKLIHQLANAHIRVCDAVFTLPTHLLGSWAAGPLSNRGHGRIEFLGDDTC